MGAPEIRTRGPEAEAGPCPSSGEWPLLGLGSGGRLVGGQVRGPLRPGVEDLALPWDPGLTIVVPYAALLLERRTPNTARLCSGCAERPNAHHPVLDVQGFPTTPDPGPFTGRPNIHTILGVQRSPTAPNRILQNQVSSAFKDLPVRIRSICCQLGTEGLHLPCPAITSPHNCLALVAQGPKCPQFIHTYPPPVSLYQRQQDLTSRSGEGG